MGSMLVLIVILTVIVGGVALVLKPAMVYAALGHARTGILALVEKIKAKLAKKKAA